MISAFYSCVLIILCVIAGIKIGILLAKNIGKYIGIINNVVTGFVGGVLIIQVSFETIPSSFLSNSFYYSIPTMILGVIVVSYFDSINLETVANLNKTFIIKNFKDINLLFKTVLITNLPLGFICGVFFSRSFESGIKFGITIAIHSIIHGICLLNVLEKTNVSSGKNFTYTMVFPIVAVLGFIIQSIIYSISPFYTMILSTFFGGSILYVSCGKILPVSDNDSEGFIKTIFAIVGFLIAALNIY